jgi:hypothetical protein
MSGGAPGRISKWLAVEMRRSVADDRKNGLDLAAKRFAWEWPAFTNLRR